MKKEEVKVGHFVKVEYNKDGNYWDALVVEKMRNRVRVYIHETKTCEIFTYDLITEMGSEIRLYKYWSM